MYRRTKESRAKAIELCKTKDFQRGSDFDYLAVILNEYNQSLPRIKRANDYGKKPNN